jgi:DNA (cytosine-5)-methyltransferase 1|nr:MAG TPA: Cytosine specific methyltransferase [Caudoviricetes sp.]
MKLMSLFDGSGGFPLAASLCGIEPVYAAEVEPYSIAVTNNRFPKMKHLGDVSKVKGGEIEPVDIITFGSPCQDMSIAGKRAGLKHADIGDEETTRSGLFLEAIRIIKEMREATNGGYPRYAVWENVPGAFSSNKGEDFRTVLDEFIKIVEKDAVMPDVPKAGWPYADCYSGNGWSLAYRVFDAQYWGVPQRRRRIYLVADFRGQRAGEILLKPEGLRRISAQSGTQGQETARCAKNSVGTAIGGVDRYNQSFLPGLAQTLRASGGGDCTPTVLAPVGKEKTVAVPVHYIVRRLTPTECARLQGFPDLWGYLDKKESFTDEEYKFWLEVRNTYTRINNKAVKDYTKAQMLSWYNKLHSDSAEYKMWGNGIALPNALYVMQGIAAEAEIPINLF